MPRQFESSAEENFYNFLTGHELHDDTPLELGRTKQQHDAQMVPLLAEIDATAAKTPTDVPDAVDENVRLPADPAFGYLRPSAAEAPAKPYLSRYDRAFLRLKEAEKKLAALPEDTKPGVRFFYAKKAEKAKEGVSKALKAAESDLGRKRDEIDEWRTTPDGRAHHAEQERNRYHAGAEAKGKQVRAYLDLSDLTAEEKAERKRQQTRDRVRRHRAAKKAAQG